MKDSRKAIHISLILHRWLLRLYPVPFRERFEDELTVDFADRSRETLRERGTVALIRLWLRSLIDLVSNALLERISEMTKSERNLRGFLAALLTALLVSVLLGYLNLHNDEVQIPFGLLLLSTFLLGLFRPRHFWIWAIVIAMSIPVSSLLSLKIGVYYPCRPGHPYSCEPPSLSGALTTTILLAPALVSAFCGSLLGRNRIETPSG